MKSRWDDDEILSDINVTPLVDIMLVLLIVFMVTTTFMLTPSIPVELPKAKSAVEPPSNAYALVLDKDGTLYLNGEKSSFEEVSAELKRAHDEDDKVQAIIAADGAVDYQSVIGLIDLVKSSGVKNFALNVQRE